MGLAGDYMDYSDLVLQASILGGHVDERTKDFHSLLNVTNRSATGGETPDPELEAELFQGYPSSLLSLATLFCLLFMLVGIPGNLITIIALFRCKKREANADLTCPRSYSSNKKEDIIDKLENIDQKIDKLVREKTIACLETRCKQQDGGLPDCKASIAVTTVGRKESVEVVPSEPCTPKPHYPDTCLRPFADPCPPFPVKPCMPHFRPLDPCREPCNRPKMPHDKDSKPKIMKLSIRTMKILLGLTTLLAFVVVYKMLIFEQEEKKHSKGKIIIRGSSKKKKRETVPNVSAEFPSYVPYIIVGGGTAAYSAMKTVTTLDDQAKILLISSEYEPPYDRTPLNDQLLTGDPSLAKQLMFIPRQSNETATGSAKKPIYFEQDTYYSSIGSLQNLSRSGAVVSIALGWPVVKIDGDQKFVQLQDGKNIKYDKCILATGSYPKILPVFADNKELASKVTNYRTLDDYKVLEKLLNEKGNNLTIAIVGGGLTASELASSLKIRGVKVIQIFKEKGNMRKLLPEYLSDWLTKKMVNLGVTILKNTEILDAYISQGGEDDGRVALVVDKQKTVYADHVYAFGKNKPNTELAEASGIEVDDKRGGFVVNRELQIRKDLYAAGDCISFYDGKYGRRVIQNYEHAIESGKLAAENLLGKGKPFNLQPMLWSDVMPQLGYEAVGMIDSTLHTVGIYMKEKKSEVEKINDDPKQKEINEGNPTEIEDFYKGAVFYLKNETVVGILTWNIFQRAPLIRTILSKDLKYNDIDQLAKFLNIHM